jgi:CDP-glycerol glycerophosphotransferase (TagB/SpsB family)
MPQKYRDKIVYKYSLDHIKYFFASNKFIGTETMPHAIQLRAVNKPILKKLSDPDNEYVFLQHGVMYMISLNAGMRDGFRKMNIKLHRVVVSSEREAQHFIDLARYEPQDLYVCGLPKFDTAFRYDDADKIIIMPTWRRWEVNEASVNVENTNYFKMILRIIDAIPERLQEHVVVLPHPLMMEAIRSNDKYNRYLPQGDVVYDELLRHCRLLITDYSSISYDAFYRGSNVIFYWEEKDECLTHYGQYAFLCLNDDNAFGDVCYDQEDLRKVVEVNYDEEQTAEHLAKYRDIVTYHDGKNTDRLIAYLKADHVI